MNISQRLSVVAALAVGALALTGCAQITAGVTDALNSARDAQTSEPSPGDSGSSGSSGSSGDSGSSSATDVDVFSLRVGDCMNVEPFSGSTNTVPVVPCNEPHSDEIYAVFDITDGVYPGEDAVIDIADRGCYDSFAGFVGVAYEDSVLDFWNLYPTEGSWADGDREVLCVVWDPASDTTGSLRGVAR